MDWIDVKDEKPKEEMKVWCINANWQKIFLVATYFPEPDIFGLEPQDPLSRTYIPLNITHWIPYTAK